MADADTKMEADMSAAPASTQPGCLSLDFSQNVADRPVTSVLVALFGQVTGPAAASDTRMWSYRSATSASAILFSHSVFCGVKNIVELS